MGETHQEKVKSQVDDTSEKIQASTSATNSVVLPSKGISMAPTVSETSTPATLLNLSNLPDAWDIDSEDIEQSWEVFKTEFELFEDMVQLDEQPEKTRRAIFAKSIGPKGRLWCRAIEVDFKSLTVGEIMAKIESRVKKTTSQTLRDFNFWHDDLRQKDGESFDCYLARVFEAANKCEFRDVEGQMSVSDRLIRSRLIIGIADPRAQENLLARDLSLEELIRKCRARESGLQHARSMKAKAMTGASAGDQASVDQNRIAAVQTGGKNGKGLCPRCATIHQEGSCWAKNMQCHACKGTGHIARCCLSATRTLKSEFGNRQRRPEGSSKQKWKGKKRVHRIKCEESSEDDSDCSEYEINAIWEEFTESIFETLPRREVEKDLASRRNTERKRRWEEIVTIAGQSVLIKIDTGADVSVIPKILFDKLTKGKSYLKVRRSKARLVSYFGDEHQSDSVLDI